MKLSAVYIQFVTLEYTETIFFSIQEESVNRQVYSSQMHIIPKPCEHFIQVRSVYDLQYSYANWDPKYCSVHVLVV